MSTKDDLATEVEETTKRKRIADLGARRDTILAAMEGQDLAEDEYLTSTGEIAKDEPKELEKADFGNAISDKNGYERFIFSPSKSRDAILRRYQIAMELSNDKKIWGYNNLKGTWTDHTVPFLANEIYEKVGDDVNRSKLAEVIDRLQVKLQTEPVTFDGDPFLMPLQNGCVDLREGRESFRPLESGDHATFQYNAEWDPDNADWRPFLWHLCSALPDPADVLTALDIVTAIALRIPMSAIVELLGGGSNGKGIFEKVLLALFTPKRGTQIELSELMRSRFGPGVLLNKDFWIVSEVKTAKDANNALKKIATGEMLDVDVKYATERLQGVPHLLPILDANNAIEFGDDSWGMARRLIRLNFCYRFGDDPGDRPMDPLWEEKLKQPEVLAGIIQIIAARAPALARSRKITVKAGAELQDQEYKRQLHSLHYFCDECLDEGVGEFDKRLTSDTAYSSYLEYCELYKVPSPSARAPFGKYLKERFGVKSERTSTVGDDGKTKYIRYYPRLFVAKKVEVAYAELHADYAGICQDTPALCQEWIKDNSILLAFMPAMPANPILSSVIEEIKRMYKYIHSCEDDSQIVYKRFVNQFAGIAGIAGINASKQLTKENTSRHNAGIPLDIAGITTDTPTNHTLEVEGLSIDEQLAQAEEIQKEKDEHFKTPTKPKLRLVRFLETVPAFVGVDGNRYGPFGPDDVANLPAVHAQNLFKKNAVIGVTPEAA